MSKSCVLVMILLFTAGCEGDTIISPPTSCVVPVVQASVVDAIANDGIGAVIATDTTQGANSWLWTLTACTPDRSESRTFGTTCPLGQIRWSVTSCRDGCCDSESNTIPVS